MGSRDEAAARARAEYYAEQFGNPSRFIIHEKKPETPEEVIAKILKEMLERGVRGEDTVLRLIMASYEHRIKMKEAAELDVVRIRKPDVSLGTHALDAGMRFAMETPWDRGFVQRVGLRFEDGTSYSNAFSRLQEGHLIELPSGDDQGYRLTYGGRMRVADVTAITDPLVPKIPQGRIVRLPVSAMR